MLCYTGTNNSSSYISLVRPGVISPVHYYCNPSNLATLPCKLFPTLEWSVLGVAPALNPHNNYWQQCVGGEDIIDQLVEFGSSQMAELTFPNLKDQRI